MARPERTRTRTRGGRSSTPRHGERSDLTPAAHDLLQRAVEEAARLLESDGAMIYLLDPVDGVLHFAHDAGIEKLSNRRWVRKLELRLGQGMFGVATAERRVVVTRDYGSDESFAHAEATDRFVREVGLRSMVVAPLAAAERTFGAMGAFSRRVDAFNDAQIALVRSLADHAAAAIANALLIDELAESRTKLERQAEAEHALREIAARLTAIREPAELLQHVVDEANRLVRGDGTILDLLDPATNRLHWAYDSGLGSLFTDEETRDLWLPVGEGATGIAVAEDRVVAAGDDLPSQFPPSPASALFFSRTGFRSMIAAPIAAEDRPLGALEVYSARPNAFDDADASLIRAFADQAAIAIENARLIKEIDESRAEIERRADAERALRQIAANISAIRDSSVVLQQTVSEATRLLRADGGIIDLLDRASQHLRWAFDTGLFEDVDHEAVVAGEVRLGEGVAGTAVAEGRVIRTGDYLNHPYPRSNGADHFTVELGIKSVIVAPIIGETGPVGAIEVFSRRTDAFDDLDAAVLGGLADQAAIAIQNAQLIEQLGQSRAEIERRADAETTLRQISASLSAIRDSQVVLQQTVDEALRLLESRDARIDLLEDGRMVWRFTATSRDIGAFDTARDTGFAIGEGVAGLVVQEGKPFRTGDYLGDDRFVHTPGSDTFVRETGMQSVIAAPLIGESGPLGVISVATDRPHAYDDTDGALLEALANQATIAIQNARLIEALERSQTDLAKRARIERALREMASAIAELREPDELLRRIVEDTRRLLGSDGAHLTRISPDGADLVPQVVASDDEVGGAWLAQLRFPVNAGINGLAAGQGEPVWTADYTRDDRIPLEPDDLDVARRMGLCGMASAPLRSPEGTVIGTLAVSYRTPHAFDDEEIAILKSLADHAAIAVTNTTLYERLRQSQARYRHLVQNSPDIVWSVDANARFTFVSATVERLTGRQPLELLGKHFGELIHDSSREVAEIDWTRSIIVPNQELRGRVNLLHRDGHPIPAEFIAMVALDADGRFAGANGSVRDMTHRDALERDLRRQAAELAAGEERSHLARELHDSVTQALFSMTLLTRTIEMQLERNPDAARAQLVILRDLQREALAEMRALIFELRPGNLEQDGLIHALRTHSAALQGRIGLPIVVTGTELPERLPIEIEEVLYRIAQEALHNVVKHAGAREARLELEKVAGEVRLRIVDDGRGFDPDRVPTGHLGLAGMRARAAKIGADLHVRSSPVSGTTVELAVPAEAIVAARERARASANQLEEERQTAAATSSE